MIMKSKFRVWFYGILSSINLVLFNISAKHSTKEIAAFNLAILCFTGLMLWLEIKRYNPKQ